LVYLGVSVLIVIYNKRSIQSFKFDFPIFITWIQQVITFLCILFLAKIARRLEIFSFVPPFEFHIATLWHAFPLSSVFTAMIIVNSLFIEHVEVSLQQVFRPMTIYFSLILPLYITQEQVSISVVQTCLVVSFGSLLCCVGGPLIFTPWSASLGLLSTFLTVIYITFIKKLLPDLDNDEWKLLVHHSLCLVLVLMPAVYISGEFHLLLKAEDTGKTFNIHLGKNGILCGFLANITLFSLVKNTSTLTSVIFGNLRTCTQLIMTYLIWNDSLSLLNGLGIMTMLLGIFWYFRVKQQELKMDIVIWDESICSGEYAKSH